MAKVTLISMLSLDGVTQGPGAPDEDTRGGFALGGWVAPYVREGMERQMAAYFDRAEAFLLGRRTYEIFAGFWPKVPDTEDPVIAKRLNGLPKYVASHTLDRVDWAHARLLAGEATDAVRELRAGPGPDLQIHGSGALARSLMAEDLIDEFILLRFPVLLGAGQRLFDGAPPSALRLTTSTTTEEGITVHTYALAGRPSFGTAGA